jgi:carbon monoxide dehydrogenase subunit G
VRIKVGPITVSYNGTASITERDDDHRTATLHAEGRETTGPGSARATAHMSVEGGGNGSSTVRLLTDYTVAGRIANFGRGVMEDVSKRLVSQMADCIKASLESEQQAATETQAPVASGAPAPAAAAPTTAPATAPAAARPVNALGLFFSVLWARIRRLFGGR